MIFWCKTKCAKIEARTHNNYKADLYIVPGRLCLYTELKSYIYSHSVSFGLCLSFPNNLAYYGICLLFKCYLNIILTQHHIGVGGVEVGVGIECGFGAAFERIAEVAVLAHPVT